jgi:hypothetical protein
MSKAEKLFERMKRNPLDGFTIDHVKTVCRQNCLSFDPPTRGSHFTISHQSQSDILTVPSKRPIKPVYIRKLVAYVEAVKAVQNAGENSIPNRNRTPA